MAQHSFHLQPRCRTGIFIFWLLGIYKPATSAGQTGDRRSYIDLFSKSGFIKKAATSRWPQTVVMLLAMMLVYVVILTSVFGTKMSGRNLGVLLMWAIWLFLLIAILTPFLGRIWCTICPLPFFGDWFQRKSVMSPVEGIKGEYKNSYSGLFLKWPVWLRNSWPKLIILLALTTFSTTLVALPKVTGYAVISLLVLPTAMALVFEHRAFCRYLCPVSGFLGPFRE
jgi:polyferredoxin